MKKNFNIVGVFAILTLLFGLIFQILRWPLPKILLLVGSMLAIIFVVYESFFKKAEDKKGVEIKIAGFTISFFIFSMMFFSMNWPANFWLLMASLLLVIISVILVLIKLKDEAFKVKKNGVILIGICILIACFNFRVEMSNGYIPLLKSIVYLESHADVIVNEELKPLEQIKEQMLQREGIDYLFEYPRNDNHELKSLGSYRVIHFYFKKEKKVKDDLLELLIKEDLESNYLGLINLCKDEPCSLGDFLVEYNLLKIELSQGENIKPEGLN
jgi:hypothetical protein